MPSPELLSHLRSIVGPSGYLDQAADIEPYLVDHRKLYRGATSLVLRPDSTDQVSRILAACNEAGVGVVPVGGNTSYCGGTVPDEDGSEIVLALGRLKRVRTIDPINNTMIVEAGCVLAEVQKAAEGVDRLFPLSLGSEGSCQIGGNLSTNAGGTAVLHYGMTRDLVLGLEVVLADGRVLDGLKGLRKDNTGYDLKHLFMGAEGTLGVITAASLKLFPRPVSVATALISVPTPQAAVDLLGRLRSATGSLTTFELMPRIGLELTAKHINGVSDPFDAPSPWYVLAEATSPRAGDPLESIMETALGDAMEAGLLADAVVAQSEAQRQMFWRIREQIPEAQRQEGASIKHDVSVMISRLPAFMEEGAAIVKRLAPTARLVAYGHLGDGNLHFNVTVPIGGDGKQFLASAPAINEAIHDLIAEYRGSISAEHGIGRLKRGELEHYKSSAELEVMRAVKQALDPRGIMNPGKVL
ncbi:MAG: FAD-binding oxidoreductase [Steroidobacteraceae bacterium]